MDRKSQIQTTKVFYEEYSRYHYNDYFMYMIRSLCNEVFNNRNDAYERLHTFVDDIKQNYPHDYGNHIKPYIKHEWFCVIDYVHKDED